MIWIIGAGVVAFGAAAISIAIAWGLERGRRISYERDVLELQNGIDDANDELQRERTANIAERKHYQARLKRMRESIQILGDTPSGRSLVLAELDELLSPQTSEGDPANPELPQGD